MLCKDDTEKANLEDGELAKAMHRFCQSVPAGRSKGIAKRARALDLPALEWSCFGLSNGPASIAKIAPGLARRGQLVRFIEILVASEKRGGVLAHGDLRGRAKRRERERIMKRIEDGIDTNHGVLFDAWIKLLLRKHLEDRVVVLVDEFVDIVAPGATPAHRRLAAKFGCAYAAGVIAIKHALLPWSVVSVTDALSGLYRRALRTADPKAAVADRAVSRLKGSLEKGRFLRHEHNSGVPELANDSIGIAIRKGLRVTFYLSIERLAEDLGIGADGLRRALFDRGALTTRGNNAASRQLRVITNGKEVKLRFWLLNLNALPSA